MDKLKTKTCIKCGKTLFLESFEKCNQTIGGRRNVCNSCRYMQRKKLPSWEKRKKEAVRAARLYRQNNPDYMKDYCKNNREKIRELSRCCVQNNYEYYSLMRKISAKANYFIKTRNIKRSEYCQHCKQLVKTEMHHPDYEKAYEVVFLCRHCHKRVHSNLIPCPKPVDLVLKAQ